MVTANPAHPKFPLPPPDHALVAQTIKAYLPADLVFRELVPLAGDASNRRYYRAMVTGGPPHSVIVMQLAEPEAFKQSEEAVSGAAHQILELPFINIMAHLAKVNVPVPALHHYDRSAGLLYLEDFGDVTLAEAVTRVDAPILESRYKQAINVLVQMQFNATTPADRGCLAFHRSFDVPLLMWEFDHFLEYGIEARNGQPLPDEDKTAIRREFESIADLLADQPRVFTHRDYHSRNLMVDGLRLGVIDFQDALMGPATYDLASLLRDAYIQLDETLVDDLLDYYLDQLAERRFVWANRAAFRRLFDLTSIQRNLKAAGRFVYIDRVKGNPKFLEDIPRVLGYVKRNLAKYPELDTLRKYLTPYVLEMQ
ncbi:MAG: phosphotransferase [Nitrospira sp.]|nr:phosphotransferase [Nitrospira sp.]MDH4369226.1 phosphotransferase [Nitrospira sp.]MDH5346345.1 phosphotransferase [Nitrospira sp.]MDH5496676.1 phosphotransferase [Nitrospira sp.]MDH5726770.1 phosphotransferase [Nitrospira sp.]